MPIAWAAALRMYAKETGSFVLPKKGTEAYEKVKKIQQGTEMSEEHTLKRKVKKEKEPKMVKEKEPKMVKEKEPKMVKEKAPKKSLARKERAERAMKDKAVEMPPAMKNDTKMIDVPEIDKREKVLKNPEAIPVAKSKRGVNRTGKTLAQNDVDYLENKNIGEGQDMSYDFPGQKEKIQKALKKKPADKLVTVGNGEEKTIDGMKTDDAVAIEGGSVQFSFQALRNRLLA
jgi:hypothetical protein